MKQRLRKGRKERLERLIASGQIHGQITWEPITSAMRHRQITERMARKEQVKAAYQGLAELEARNKKGTQ